MKDMEQRIAEMRRRRAELEGGGGVVQRGKIKACRALRGKLVPRSELLKLLKTNELNCAAFAAHNGDQPKLP